MNNDSHVILMLALIQCLKSVGIIVLSAFLFFNSVLGFIILIPYGLFSIYKIARMLGERQRGQVVNQFKDFLGCMLTAMEAGISAERSIYITIDDLIIMHGERSYIVKKLREMTRRLELSESIEDIFVAFAEETRIREIENFADIFYAAKRTGGDIINLIRSATVDLYEKLEIRREIEGMIASARMECSVMKFMPLAILLYLRVFSFGLLEPLYTTAFGRMLMIAVAVIYFVLAEYSDALVEKAVQ